MCGEARAVKVGMLVCPLCECGAIVELVRAGSGAMWFPSGRRSSRERRASWHGAEMVRMIAALSTRHVDAKDASAGTKSSNRERLMCCKEVGWFAR